MTDIVLGRCPFCGSDSARLSRREMRFYGWRDVNGRMEKIVDYGYQVICNRCKARGPLQVRYGCTKEEVEKGRFDPPERMQAMFMWNIRKVNGKEVYDWTHFIGTDGGETNEQ